MLFLPCLMLAMKGAKLMKIKRMVKHSDTEYEIMEFELTATEMGAAYDEYKEYVTKEWMRNVVFNAEFLGDYDELTDEQLDEAYSMFEINANEGEWENARDSLACVLEGYKEE